MITPEACKPAFIDDAPKAAGRNQKTQSFEPWLSKHGNYLYLLK